MVKYCYNLTGKECSVNIFKGLLIAETCLYVEEFLFSCSTSGIQLSVSLVGGSKVENVFLIQTSKTTNNIRNKYGDEGLNAFVFSNCKNKIHVKIMYRETTHYYTVLNVS